MRLIDLVMTKNFFAPLFLAATLAAANGQTNEQRFGFTGPEIFPIDPLVSLIHAADIDGDGKIDLVLVNNARSKINILYNQTGQTNTAPTPENLARSGYQLRGWLTVRKVAEIKIRYERMLNEFEEKCRTSTAFLQGPFDQVG